MREVIISDIHNLHNQQAKRKIISLYIQQSLHNPSSLKTNDKIDK